MATPTSSQPTVITVPPAGDRTLTPRTIWVTVGIVALVPFVMLVVMVILMMATGHNILDWME